MPDRDPASAGPYRAETACRGGTGGRPSAAPATDRRRRGRASGRGCGLGSDLGPHSARDWRNRDCAATTALKPSDSEGPGGWARPSPGRARPDGPLRRVWRTAGRGRWKSVRPGPARDKAGGGGALHSGPPRPRAVNPAATPPPCRAPAAEGARRPPPPWTPSTTRTPVSGPARRHAPRRRRARPRPRRQRRRRRQKASTRALRRRSARPSPGRAGRRPGRRGGGGPRGAARRPAPPLRGGRRGFAAQPTEPPPGGAARPARRGGRGYEWEEAAVRPEAGGG
jgi:translation initiation factor IF-2